MVAKISWIFWNNPDFKYSVYCVTMCSKFWTGKLYHSTLKAHSYWLSKDMLIAFTWQSSYVFKNLCKPSNLASKYSLPHINLGNSQHWHLGYCFPGTFYKLINYALKFHFTDYYFLMSELIIFHWKYFIAECYYFIGRF